MGRPGMAAALGAPSPTAAPLRPLILKVGAPVEAIREEGDDEWEAATVSGFDDFDGTVSLTFEDRFRAPKVPLRRIRAPMAAGAAGAESAAAAAAAPSAASKAPPPPPELQPALQPSWLPPAAPSGAAAALPAGVSSADRLRAFVAASENAPRPSRPALVRKRVRLHGLAGKPELNGAFGLAVSFDAKTGRYAVRLEADGTRIAIKPDNLARADDVSLDAQTGRPETDESNVVVVELEDDAVDVPDDDDGGAGAAASRHDGARPLQPPPAPAATPPLPSPEEARALFDRLWKEKREAEDGPRVVDVTDE